MDASSTGRKSGFPSTVIAIPAALFDSFDSLMAFPESSTTLMLCLPGVATQLMAATLVEFAFTDNVVIPMIELSSKKVTEKLFAPAPPVLCTVALSLLLWTQLLLLPLLV